MSSLYIETSAILSWLFGEDRGEEVVSILDGCEEVVSSVLSCVETERALIRIKSQGLVDTATVQKIKGQFSRVSGGWLFLELTASIRARASEAFPIEPVRALDAIHLASALEAVQLYPTLRVLSLDNRILENLDTLGLDAA